METSEPTRIKQGENLPVVPSAPPAEIELFERSPTLMAGEVAGSQGSVRVWSPSRKLLWFTVIGTGLLTLPIAYAVFFLHLYSLLYFLIPAGGFSVSVASLRRPRLVVTDDAGIAITTKAASIALRWEDIATASHIPGPPRILLCAPYPVEIALSGFPASVRKELMDTIITRARLVPHALHNPNFLYMSERTLAQMEHNDWDIRHEITAGRKIQAIKLYRQRYGTGLKESKDVIDLMALDAALSNAKTSLGSGQSPAEARAALLDLIAAGKTAQAESLYRGWTNSSRREAVEAIRHLQIHQPPAALAPPTHDQAK